MKFAPTKKLHENHSPKRSPAEVVHQIHEISKLKKTLRKLYNNLFKERVTFFFKKCYTIMISKFFLQIKFVICNTYFRYLVINPKGFKISHGWNRSNICSSSCNSILRNGSRSTRNFSNTRRVGKVSKYRMEWRWFMVRTSYSYRNF